MSKSHSSTRASEFPKALEIGEHRPLLGVSLYTGAMGLDLGLERTAGVRFAVAAEIDPAARETIRTNRPEIRVLRDAGKLTAAQIRRAAGIGDSDVIDLVAGCPPCPPWSVAGKRQGIADPRGILLARFVDLAIALKSRVIIHENVPGLVSAEFLGVKGGLLRLVVTELRRRGYRVVWKVVNAADFGTPQSRDRLVLIACWDGEPRLPTQTHSRDGRDGLPKWRTIRDAVEGLPDWPVDHVDYPPSVRRYMVHLRPGQCWNDLSPDLRAEAVSGGTLRDGGATGTLRRLSWGRPCPTVTTSPGQKMTTLGHPDEDRPLSVQECARVQGFPDGWRICGTVRQRYVQVGNAVPVQLAEAIGRAVAETLGEHPPHRSRHRQKRQPSENRSDGKQNMLSRHVRKKGDRVLSFSIAMPGDKCPFASDLCARLCYAKRGQHRLHYEKYASNYEFTQDKGFVETMCEEIRRVAEAWPQTKLAVCVHEKGELYSLQYLRKWRQAFEATADLPNVRHYVYTRAWISPRFRKELEAIAKSPGNVRINLSTDREMVKKHGMPERIGDGLVTYLAETDEDLPPEGADLVLRNSGQRSLPPLDSLGGVTVCPNESRLHFAIRDDGHALLTKGKPVRIRCDECRLCIDRSLPEWRAIESRHRLPEFRRHIKFADVFSGIGALRLGFEQACRDEGIEPECVWACDNNPEAATTYRRNFPSDAFDPFCDVTTVEPGEIPDFDFLLAGWPCQPWSRAGRQKGFADARGTLFFDLARIIDAKKPKAFLLENVDRLVTHDDGRTFTRVLEILGDELGYSVFWQVLNSKDYGVPQNRKRVYIVGFRNDSGGFEFPDGTDSTKRLKHVLETKAVNRRRYLSEKAMAGMLARKAVHEAKGNGFGFVIRQRGDVAGTLVRSGMGLEMNLIRDPRPGDTGAVRTLTPVEYERLQGLPDGWTRHVADTHRYRLIGNAVTVTVVRAISCRIMSGLFGTSRSIADFAFPLPTRKVVRLRDVLLPDSETADYIVAPTHRLSLRERKIRPGSNGSHPQGLIRIGDLDGRSGQGYRTYSDHGHAATICSKAGGLGAKTGLYLVNGKVRRLAPRECARAMGLPDDFVLPDCDEQAWEQIGNSVTVPVVKMILEQVMKALDWP